MHFKVQRGLIFLMGEAGADFSLVDEGYDFPCEVQAGRFGAVRRAMKGAEAIDPNSERFAVDRDYRRARVGEFLERMGPAMTSPEDLGGALTRKAHRESGLNEAPVGSVLELDGHHLTLAEVSAVLDDSGHSMSATLSEEARARAARTAGFVAETAASGKVVYGVSTGIGDFAKIAISIDQAAEFQANLLESHGCSSTDLFSPEVVRTALLLLINKLARGDSGMRPQTIDRLIQMFDRGVVPWVPSRGSLGASGDLSPLAHVGQVLIGKGKAKVGDGPLISGAKAMAQADIPVEDLSHKEGLSLINGLHFVVAVSLDTLRRARTQNKTINIAAALSLEGLLGKSNFMDPRVHVARPHRGQIETAEVMRRLLHGSHLIDAKVPSAKPQDPYSFRCMPQFTAPVLDALRQLAADLEVELNASTDNPLVFPSLDGQTFDAVSGGNFHGQKMAADLTALKTAAYVVGLGSARRSGVLIHPSLNNGLSACLATSSGLESGLMIPQYSVASFVNHASMQGVPAYMAQMLGTSLGQEDLVSMAPNEALSCMQILADNDLIAAWELLFAAQAVDLRARAFGLNDVRESLGQGTATAWKAVRDLVPMLERDDHALSDDVEIIAENLVRNGRLAELVEVEVGPLWP